MTTKTYDAVKPHTVAFLGLGVMGYPMAGHLARAGHRVTVYNRTAKKADQWVDEHGGRAARTPREAALEAGRVKPGALILMPGFGGGLTLCSHLVKWGERLTPLATTDIDLPPCTQSALEIVNAIRARKHAHDSSQAGLMSPHFAEAA